MSVRISTDPPPAGFLSPATRVARKDGFVEAELDGEILTLSIEHGTCYGFNLTGSKIWNVLAKPTRVGDLCATLLTEYKVAPDVCEREVLDLLEELRAEGLITTLNAE